MSVLLPPEAYRYTLFREVELPLLERVSGPRRHLLYTMQNPSTASAVKWSAQDDDQTIRKCIGFARRWGFGSFAVVNLWAYRATKQAELWAAQARGEDVVGRITDEVIRIEAEKADVVVCAWGALWRTPALERIDAVTKLLLATKHEALYCIGTNRDGSPKHPCMAGYVDRPVLWRSR